MDTDTNGIITKTDLYDSSDTITREEMLKAEDERFDRMDVNKDAKLSKDEFIVNDMSL